jgi:ATP-binding cassette subfamily F protein uup
MLSGGERRRLELVMVLATKPNLLVLDEPTNDLDLETLDVLEEMLSDYAGTVILISHDRDFLDRVVDSVVAPEGDGHWIEYAGGYSDMLAQRGTDLARDQRRPTQQATVKEAPAATETPEPAKRKMTFKDKHALETLPKTIAALRTEAEALQARLGDPQLYVRDRLAFEKASSDLGYVQRKIAAAEERWLELEIIREELAGS